MKRILLFVLLVSSITLQAKRWVDLFDKGYFHQIGIEISQTELQKAKTHQLEKLAAFDFNPYRNYTSNRSIQIANGPKIELLPITQMQKMGYTVAPEIVANKKGEVPITAQHALITLIDIGWNYPPVNPSSHYERDGN